MVNAQTNEAISREVSVFNLGQPSASVEAVSREVSVFNLGVPTANIEAISREVSVFNLGIPSSPLEAISREVSVYNQGAQYLVLTLGSTVLRAGDTGSVPVTLFSLAPITNVQFTVDFPADRLTNWNAQPLSSASCHTSVTNDCQLCVTFNPTNGQTFVNTQRLGQITFTAASNQPSAFLPLCISNAAGPLLQGGLTLDQRFHNGEVVVIHNNPLLRASPNINTTAGYSFTLYGMPGTNYTIEATTNLNPPVMWKPMFCVNLNNFIWKIKGLEMTNAQMFFRAQAGVVGTPYLDVALGSTVLRAGATGGVPVTLFSYAPITNVELDVSFPAACLTNWSLQSDATLTGTAILSGSNGLHLTFNPPGGGTFFSSCQLGKIVFTAASNQPSAFLPLRIKDASGPLQDGTQPQDKRLHNGAVVVIHRKPLLHTLLVANKDFKLTLYGLPGTNYTIEAATNLLPPVTWTPVESINLTNSIWPIGDMKMTNAVMFFRAQESQ